MTASQHPNIAIFAHDRQPNDHAGVTEYFVERLLATAADSYAPWAMQLVRKHRPDLTDDQFTEAVDAVYEAAAEVTAATGIGQPRRLDDALDRYAECLHELAIKPDDLCDLVTAVQPDSPVKLRSVP